MTAEEARETLRKNNYCVLHLIRMKFTKVGGWQCDKCRVDIAEETHAEIQQAIEVLRK